jgi:small redox-active disulfide protein 2
MLKIEVLGPDCATCDDTFEKVKQVLEELKMEVELTKVTDIFQIIDRGVNFTPALMVNGKLMFQGKVPTAEQIRKILQEQIFAKDKLK